MPAEAGRPVVDIKHDRSLCPGAYPGIEKRTQVSVIGGPTGTGQTRKGTRTQPRIPAWDNVPADGLNSAAVPARPGRRSGLELYQVREHDPTGDNRVRRELDQAAGPGLAPASTRGRRVPTGKNQRRLLNWLAHLNSCCNVGRITPAPVASPQSWSRAFSSFWRPARRWTSRRPGIPLSPRP